MSYSLQISQFIQTQTTNGTTVWSRHEWLEGEGECSSAGCSTLRSCCELYLQLLLQVAVDFEAVVARIGHHDVSVRGESQPLWAVQRVCRCVDVRQEGTAAVKHLTDRETSQLFYWTLILSGKNWTAVMWGEIIKIILWRITWALFNVKW